MLRKALVILLLTAFPFVGFAKLNWCSECYHPFVDVGYSAAYINNPKVDIASNTGGSPLAKITDSGWTHTLNLATGYTFYNRKYNMLTRLFGHENTVAFKFNYYNRNATTRKSNLGTGSIFYVNGDGDIYGPDVLFNFYLRAQQLYQNFNLIFQGHNYTIYPKITLYPYAGFVYTHLREKYHFSLRYNPNTLDIEDYRVFANYYGTVVGDKLNYQINSHLFSFAQLEGQLLYLHAKLRAIQNANNLVAGFTRYATDVSNEMTYRALLTFGLNWNFTQKMDSPGINLLAGADLWGDNPDVVPPNASNSSKIHLEKTTQLDGFIGILFHIPFG